MSAPGRTCARRRAGARLRAVATNASRTNTFETMNPTKHLDSQTVRDDARIWVAIRVLSSSRHRYHPSIGFVGFLGAAWVSGSFNEEENGRILPVIGTGTWFTADMETHLNVGFAIAAGRGDWSLSFSFSIGTGAPYLSGPRRDFELLIPYLGVSSPLLRAWCTPPPRR